MSRILIQLGNLGLVEDKGKKVYQCLKWGHVFCGSTEEYKNFALKKEASISKGQPEYLASKTDFFVLREYYCPGIINSAKGESGNELPDRRRYRRHIHRRGDN